MVTLFRYGMAMNDRLHGLEAVRGIAAIIVAWTHAQILSGSQAPAALWFDKGYLAVDLFFILSGFVLCRAFEGRMPSPRTFLQIRFVRLWGLVAIGVAFGALHYAVRGEDLLMLFPHLAAGLLILPVIGFAIFLNPPAWSIFFELVANTLHAAAFDRIGNGVLLALIGLCGVILMRFTYAEGLDVRHDIYFLLGIPRVVMSYCLGIVLCRINRDQRWVPAHWAWPVIFAFPVLVAAAGLLLPPQLEVLAVLIVGPAVILGSLSLKTSPVAVFLGAISFPLYAVHFPLQLLCIMWGTGFWATLGLSLIGSTLVALVCDRRSRAALLDVVSWKRPPRQQVA